MAPRKPQLAVRNERTGRHDRSLPPLTIDARAKRIYDPAEPGDGYRILIDHIWPRGVSRERARLDEWARELAPSAELRKWFDHDPTRFAEFRTRYRDELADQTDRLEELRRRASDGPLTILYAARDQEHNDAVVLVELLNHP
jgi:uncharacterized protein YeaO (DUF488 family)